jgi:hypothetical protein
VFEGFREWRRDVGSGVALHGRDGGDGLPPEQLAGALIDFFRSTTSGEPAPARPDG